MSDLKPCPFCGSDDILDGDAGVPTWMQCQNCGAEGPSEDTARKARDIWNIRADIHAAEVERLREALRPFAAAFYNDNGDVTISTGHITSADYRRASDLTK